MEICRSLVSMPLCYLPLSFIVIVFFVDSPESSRHTLRDSGTLITIRSSVEDGKTTSNLRIFLPHNLGDCILLAISSCCITCLPLATSNRIAPHLV